MAPGDETVALEAMTFRLHDEVERLASAPAGAPQNRAARTLVKEGRMRVTMVTLSAGAELSAHHTDGPITVHVLRGHIHFREGGREHALGPGDLLALPAGVEHAVETPDGAAFLLTVALPLPQG